MTYNVFSMTLNPTPYSINQSLTDPYTIFQKMPLIFRCILFLQVICWEAGIWVPVFFNFCHSFLSLVVLFTRLLSRCILFLRLVACPLIFLSITSHSNDSCLSTWPNHKRVLIMAALHSSCRHYIFALWFLLLLLPFFPRLISAVAELMSTILLHMVWP